jgi:hypothetical protein
MMKKLFLMTVALLGAATLCSQAALLGTYNFSSGDTTVPTAAGMTFGAFSRQNVTAASGGAVFLSTGWNTGSAIDSGEYVQFTITPTSGFLTFSSLSFTVDSHKSNGANDGGPDSVQVMVFASDNLGTALATSQIWTGVQDSTQTLTFDPADQTRAAGFTVRFYGWSAENANGELYLDNVAVNGSLSAVPEPANVALLVFGVCVVGMWTGRRWFRKLNRAALW